MDCKVYYIHGMSLFYIPKEQNRFCLLPFIKQSIHILHDCYIRIDKAMLKYVSAFDVLIVEYTSEREPEKELDNGVTRGCYKWCLD